MAKEQLASFRKLIIISLQNKLCQTEIEKTDKWEPNFVTD